LDTKTKSARKTSRKKANDSAGAEARGVVIGDDGLARPPWAAVDAMLRAYYDTEWGMPVQDERGLFERLSLEAF